MTLMTVLKKSCSCDVFFELSTTRMDGGGGGISMGNLVQKTVISVIERSFFNDPMGFDNDICYDKL